MADIGKGVIELRVANGSPAFLSQLFQPARLLSIEPRQAAKQLRSLGFKKPYRSQGPFGVSVCHDPPPAAPPLGRPTLDQASFYRCSGYP
jgi:hypothetical protein